MKRPFVLILVTSLILYLHAEATDAILLTGFLKHDQAQNLTEIQREQEEQGVWKAFPPEGTTVASWDVMMSIGQVVTLEVPASKLGNVNVALEKTIKEKLANPGKKSL